MSAIIFQFSNLLGLVALIYFTSRKSVVLFAHQRHQSIRDEVDQVASNLRKAQAQFEEFTGKLKAVDAEIQSIRLQAAAEAESVKLKITNDSKRLATTILADAQASAQSLQSELRKEMRAELGSKVISRAEELLVKDLTGSEKARIRKEFSRELESVQ